MPEALFAGYLQVSSLRAGKIQESCYPADVGDIFFRHAFFTRSIRQDKKKYQIFLRIVRRLLVTANVVPSSSKLVTLIMEALSSSETSVLTTATRRHIPKDAILHSASSLWTGAAYKPVSGGPHSVSSSTH
jgi:hypothetical protein